MKKLLLILTCIITITFSFCKKKETASTPNTVTPINNNGGNNGYLRTSYNFQAMGSSISKDSSAEAQFYTAPANTAGPYLNVGTVTINSASLTMASTNDYYKNSSVMNGALTWNVTGSGTVTAFTYSYVPSYPVYTGGNLLPDTCIKSNGITLTISGLSNAPSGVFISISQNSTYVYKSIIGNGSVTFSASELSSFSVNNYLDIFLSITNRTGVTINGLPYNTVAGLTYDKYSYLK